MKRWYQAKHLARIAAALERIERGEINRLLISVPPRHWKSSLVSEKFPGWYLGKHPAASVVVVSYSATLSERFSKSVRSDIESNEYYHQLFPQVSIAPGYNRFDDWMLTTGFRTSFRAVGVNGQISGYGAKLLILDDTMVSEMQAQSELQRTNLYEWYRKVARNRLEPSGAIVGVNTRWHEGDLFGKLIEAMDERDSDQWEIINIPAIDEEGNYLWLDRYTKEEYDALKSAMGEYGWNTQFMGRPAPAQGILIKREYFDFVPHLPEGVQEQCRAWDAAMTLKQTQKSDPDFTASLGGALHNGFLYCIDPMLFRAESPEVADKIELYKVVNPHVRIGMPRRNAEIPVMQLLVRAGIPIESYSEKGDPLTRITSFLDLASRRKVILVGTPEQWEPFMAQWTAFPNGRHDDAVMVAWGLTQMFNMDFVPISMLKRPRRAIWEFADA